MSTPSELKIDVSPQRSARRQKRAKPVRIHTERQPPSRNGTFIHDDLLNDNIRHMLPNSETGWLLLALSITIQVILLTMIFLGHHNRLTTFDCCNMWAVATALSFVIIQGPYLSDWLTAKKVDPQWHRGNIYVPIIVLVIDLFAYGIGVVSMLAHAANEDILKWVNFNKLDDINKACFVICTISAGIAFMLLFLTDYAHRNAIGDHYYYIDEQPFARVYLKSTPTKNRGAFELGVVVWLANVLRIGNSNQIYQNLHMAVIVASISQVIFYVFAATAYGNTKGALGAIVILGICVMSSVHLWQYIVSAMTDSVKSLRRWHREQLWYPLKFGCAILVVYYFVMANIFFETTGHSLWDVVPELSPTEKAYFGLGIALLLTLAFLQLVIAHTHRKVWAQERDADLGVHDPSFRSVIEQSLPTDENNELLPGKTEEEAMKDELEHRERVEQRKEELQPVEGPNEDISGVSVQEDEKMETPLDLHGHKTEMHTVDEREDKDAEDFEVE